jgi:HEAT repeat protein
VPALIDALGSDSRTARHWAAKTLWQLGPASKDAVPALVRWLKQDGAIKAAAAVEALGEIGPAAAEAIPVLQAAYDALKPDQDDQSVHLALSQIGGPPSPGLIRQLGDTDPRRRVEVANLLGLFYGPKATSAVQRLEAALNDPVPLVRVSAAVALSRVDPSSPRALSVLLVALDSTDLEVLEPAITAVGELGPRAATAVPKLKRIVGRDDLAHQSYEGESLAGAIGAARFAAADALIAVSPRTDDGISALLLLVSRGGDYAKGEAIDRLGLLGTKAAAAVPALAAIARDAASIHRYGAVKALSRIDPRHAAILPALIGLLDDPHPRPMEPEEKREIIASLGLMGSRALLAVPSLVRVLKEERDEDPIGTDPAELAAGALGRIGPGAKEVYPPSSRR